MLTRKIGGFVRGNATPFQILAACLLGALIGFAPPFALAPGLVLAYLIVLIVINANLFLAALVTLAARLLALALAPLAYTLGVALLEGPARPLFAATVNAPVLAWFGLDVYATVGGIPVALALGLALGLAINAALRRFRLRMARLEEDSERYRRYAGSRSVRLAAWLLIGKGTRDSFVQLAQRRVGKPVRVIGIAIAAGILVVVAAAQTFLAGPLLTAVAQRELERLNGATVDLENASVDLAAGNATITGLAMADPQNLRTNIFAAERIELDISAADILRKRAAITLVEASGASSGTERDTPGRLITTTPPPPDPPDEDGEPPRTIDDYIEQAELWKERLTRLREWLDTVASNDPDQPAEDRTTRKEQERAEQRRRERAVAQHGYRVVRAAGLVDDTPALLIERIVSRGVRVAQLGDETIDLEARNVSTQPWLVDEPPRVVISSSRDSLNADFALGAVSRAAGRNALFIELNRLDADGIAAQLITADPPLLSGGTLDLSFRGAWEGPVTTGIDVLLEATPRNTTLAIPGLQPTDIERVTVPIALSGPINNPAIRIAEPALRRALIDAGKRELASRISEELDLDDALADTLGEDAARNVGQRARDTFGGLFGNDDEEDHNDN